MDGDGRWEEVDVLLVGDMNEVGEGHGIVFVDEMVDDLRWDWWKIDV